MSGDSPQVIDRDQEAELLEAALRSGAHVVLEGPPGTGKSTLLRQVASGHQVPFGSREMPLPYAWAPAASR